MVDMAQPAEFHPNCIGDVMCRECKKGGMIVGGYRYTRSVLNKMKVAEVKEVAWKICRKGRLEEWMKGPSEEWCEKYDIDYEEYKDGWTQKPIKKDYIDFILSEEGLMCLHPELYENDWEYGEEIENSMDEMYMSKYE